MFPKADESLDFIVASFLVLVYSQKPIIQIKFDYFSQFLQRNYQSFLKFRVDICVLSGLIVEFHKCAEEVVVHKPKVGEVVEFGLMPLKGAFEKVVEQLIALFVAHWAGPGLSYFSKLYVDCLLFLRLGLLFFLELDRQAFSHAERGLSVNVLELRTLADLFALAEKFKFALPKLLFKSELAANPQFADNDDIQKGVIHSEDLAMFVHELVQFQNLFSDLVAQGLILRPPHFVVAQQIAVELLQHGEQISSEFEQVFIHFGPDENVRAAERECVLAMATVLFEAACKAVVDDVGDNLVLLVELALLGFEEIRAGLGLGDLLQNVGQS